MAQAATPRDDATIWAGLTTYSPYSCHLHNPMLNNPQYCFGNEGYPPSRAPKKEPAT